MTDLTRRDLLAAAGVLAAWGEAAPAGGAAPVAARRLEYDVVVAGGGTAGTAAAVAAARRGHKVLLVEEANCLGGTSTSGGVCEWFANLDGMGDIFDRVRGDLQKHGAVLNGRFFNAECLKIVWQLLAQEAGVTVLLHASAVGASADAGRVKALRIVSCSQPLEAHAKFFIDATGEGDLAAAAGAEFMKGDPKLGRTLHMTLTFVLHDTGKPVQPYLPPGLEEIKSHRDLPGLGMGYNLGDGRIYFNATKVMLHDPTDPLSLSAAEMEARRQLARIVHYAQRTKFPNHALCSSGARIGIREGRRIVGDYVLSEDDILKGAARTFADGVAVATSQIDFHSLTKPGSGGWRERVDPYAIPYRCLLVKGLANVLTAGKCISGDQVAHSSYRMTPTCCGMGQAAGTAAALAVEGKCGDLRQVNVKALRGELAKAGVELDPAKHTSFAPSGHSPRKQAD